MERITLLYIDDEVNNLASFNANFRKIFTIFSTTSVREALEILKNENIQVIISDQRMPGETGLEFLSRIENKNYLKIAMTAFPDTPVLQAALSKGEIFAVIFKPYDISEVEMIIRKGFEEYKNK